VTVHAAEGEVVDVFDQPVSGRGMQYEASEVERLIAEGVTESARMTLTDSVAVMTTMDTVRGQMGVRYPYD
jgi:hypothetical protein